MPISNADTATTRRAQREPLRAALPSAWRTALALLLWAAQTPLAAAAAAPADVAALCDSAATQAAREYPVPLGVLRAVARTETGRALDGSLSPWPWTVNMEGRGKWFATRDAALAFAFRHHKEGARSFDIGCFQINYRWHHEGFASLNDMFDPLENARYAARFLTRLHGEFGSWDAAVGAYHSRTEDLAQRYLERYRRIHTGLDRAEQAPGPANRQGRRTPFIEIAGGPGIIAPASAGAPARAPLGSLVPAQAQARAPLLGTE